MKKFLKFFIFYLFTAVLSFIAVIFFPLAGWVKDNLGVSFQEILYTLAGPLNGTNSDIVNSVLSRCNLPIVGWAIGFVIFVIFSISCFQKEQTVKSTKKKHADKHSAPRKKPSFISVASLLVAVFFLASTTIISFRIGAVKYLTSIISQTKLYETEYVYPSETKITPTVKKNLIYIYVESMETTYASKDVGGAQKTNYIPNLTNYALDNVSFSNTDALGGWWQTDGSGWTLSALFATTSGLAYNFSFNSNKVDSDKVIAEKTTTLGDVLAANGYRQEFLCGSDANFAGRKQYFQYHGNYKVCDYYTAAECGYIPSTYSVWWGFEDAKLYDIAKTELKNLAAEGEPFNFTLLTADTHFPHGYVCEECPNTYKSVVENVISCADTQVAKFVEWCKKQPFYKDTVIVITGDHARMDKDLVDDVDDMSRTVYNAFLNVDSSIYANSKLKNRGLTPMDMFPTVLAALGFEIEGDRLGLGTNLFSDVPTLVERMGYDDLNDELLKYSPYYVEHF